MTDPDLAVATYIEPIEWKTVRDIIAKRSRMLSYQQWEDRLHSIAP